MEIRGEHAEVPAVGILIRDAIDEQTRSLIEGGLDAYNDDVVGYGDRKPLETKSLFRLHERGLILRRA